MPIETGLQGHGGNYIRQTPRWVNAADDDVARRTRKEHRITSAILMGPRSLRASVPDQDLAQVAL